MRYLTIFAYLYSNFKEWSDLSCVRSATGGQRKATERPDSLLPSNVWVKICTPKLIAQMAVPRAAERRLWGEGWGSNMRLGVLSVPPQKANLRSLLLLVFLRWGSLTKGKLTAVLSHFFSALQLGGSGPSQSPSMSTQVSPFRWAGHLVTSWTPVQENLPLASSEMSFNFQCSPQPKFLSSHSTWRIWAETGFGILKLNGAILSPGPLLCFWGISSWTALLMGKSFCWLGDAQRAG